VRAHGAHTRHHASCGVHCVMSRTHGIMWRTHCIVHHVSYTASCVWRTYGIMHHVAWCAGGATLAVVVTQFPPRYACPQRRQAALMKMQSDNQAFRCDSAAPRSTAGAREPRATNGPAAWELKLYPLREPLLPDSGPRLWYDRRLDDTGEPCGAALLRGSSCPIRGGRDFVHGAAARRNTKVTPLAQRTRPLAHSPVLASTTTSSSFLSP
jgi:hypothetical protein